MNERILRALYNLGVEAQLDYEHDCPILPWEETPQGHAWSELQEAISEKLYELADEEDTSTWFADELY